MVSDEAGRELRSAEGGNRRAELTVDNVGRETLGGERVGEELYRSSV